MSISVNSKTNKIPVHSDVSALRTCQLPDQRERSREKRIKTKAEKEAEKVEKRRGN